MMKKILILTPRIPKRGREKALFGYLGKYFAGEVHLEVRQFSEALIEVSSDRIMVYFGEKEATQFDLIWLRRTSEKFAVLGTALGACFDYLGVKYFDTCFGQRAIGGSKLLVLLKLAMAKLPIPLTFFCWRNEIEKRKEYFVKKLGFPLVAKNFDLHWGKGVFILKNAQDFDRVSQLTGRENQLLFQKFYPHQGDYRVLVLGYKIGAWEIMYRAGDLSSLPLESEVLKPVGDLKKKEFFSVKKIPPKMAKLAIKAAKAVSMEVAGVDFLEDANTGNYILTEVNRAPAFAVDYAGDPELKAVASFLKRSVEV